MANLVQMKHDRCTVFTIHFLQGDYRWRQGLANNLRLDLYIEYRFNHYSKSVDYTLCKVGNRLNEVASIFARTHVNLVAEEFNTQLYEEEGFEYPGVITCKRNTPAAYSISLLQCPAVIIEPLFLSNPIHSSKILSDGVPKLIEILCSSIRKTLPNGGNIGFSVGHKYQRGAPYDRGASLYSRPEYTEADLAEKILLGASFILTECNFSKIKGL